MKSIATSLRAFGAVGVLMAAGVLNAQMYCADHCYGDYAGEDSPGIGGCISYGGGSNPTPCESYGNYCALHPDNVFAVIMCAVQ
jgi:hypothetical protein